MPTHTKSKGTFSGRTVYTRRLTSHDDERRQKRRRQERNAARFIDVLLALTGHRTVLDGR